MSTKLSVLTTFTVIILTRDLLLCNGGHIGNKDGDNQQQSQEGIDDRRPHSVSIGSELNTKFTAFSGRFIDWLILWIGIY